MTPAQELRATFLMVACLTAVCIYTFAALPPERDRANMAKNSMLGLVFLAAMGMAYAAFRRIRQRDEPRPVVYVDLEQPAPIGYAQEIVQERLQAENKIGRG
jgi:hypothetical protein